jgi:hypothetical protein
MIINNLPGKIQDLIFKESALQNLYPDNKSDLRNTFVLDWTDATQGYEFWNSINKGKYDKFYKKYGLSIDNFSII